MSSSDLYKEEFEIVVKALCDGLKEYPGEIYDNLIYLIIEDLEPMFRGALSKSYVIDILDVAERFCEVGLFRLNAEGVLAKLLSLFPHPKELSEEEQFTLAQIIDPVDEALPGTLERLQWEWKHAA